MSERHAPIKQMLRKLAPGIESDAKRARPLAEVLRDRVSFTGDSADRAARLALVVDDEADRVRREEHAIAAARRHGTWRWRPVGADELQLRSASLPTLPLDLLRSEALDLMNALAKALNEKPPATPRMSKREREAQKKRRGVWNKAHAVERAHALKAMAEEFRETGGW